MGNRVGCNKPLLLKRKGQLFKKVNWIILQGVWHVGYWGRKNDKLEAGSAVIDFYKGSDVMSGL